MMSAELASWQSTNNYRKEGDMVYGVYQGCGFTVSEEDGGKLFIFMLSPRDNNAFDDFENALASAGGQLAEGQVGDVESYLALFFDESQGHISLRTMDEVLDFTAANARGCGFRVPNVCVKCGAKATKRSFVDNMVQPLCADCSAKNRQNHSHRPAAPAPTPAPAPAPITQEDDQYARQYAPLVPDSSKYDDSYDEYAGMTSQYDRGDDHRRREPSPEPISFSDSSEDDYQAIMGDDGDASANETEIGGTMGMGVVGALAGALVGVVPYLIVALAANFHMAALCFPAGMLAVVFYTMLGGVKSKALGMGLSIGFSSVISIFTMFLGMTFSYLNENTGFGGAVKYLFREQMSFFLINILFALLGSIFGALFMIGVMEKYVDGGSNAKEGNSRF